MGKIMIKRDELIKMGLPERTHKNNEIFVHDEIIGTKRWSITHKLVFKYNGKLYMTEYEEPATEMQEGEPWEYNDDVECTEVKQVKVLKNDWQAV